ncbi:hypothetical protein K9L97_01265 [Candidatus Woesearchaeota archaeon]|nr:hypothetical protein [Candidatus Woesearchaeota archaeon]
MVKMNEHYEDKKIGFSNFKYELDPVDSMKKYYFLIVQMQNFMLNNSTNLFF